MTTASDPITTRRAPDAGNTHGVTSMERLLDALLEKHSPPSEPFDPKTCRSMNCQILASGQPIAGVLSETGIQGVYRVAATAQKADKTITMVEQYVLAENIATIVVERADLAELAKRMVRDTNGGGAGKLWTPG